VLGPFGLRISSELDPVTGKIVAWKIGGWVDRDAMTVWVDGRPHPSPNAPHSYGGFTTGLWEGDTLTTYTTHMKASMIRRNGAPVSDQATMTMHIIRHGDLLTIPQEAVLGGAETMYPEYHKKLTGYTPPAICKRYCGCGGLGVPCITDGSGVPR